MATRRLKDEEKGSAHSGGQRIVEVGSIQPGTAAETLQPNEPPQIRTAETLSCTFSSRARRETACCPSLLRLPDARFYCGRKERNRGQTQQVKKKKKIITTRPLRAKEDRQPPANTSPEYTLETCDRRDAVNERGIFFASLDISPIHHRCCCCVALCCCVPGEWAGLAHSINASSFITSLISRQPAAERKERKKKGACLPAYLKERPSLRPGC